VRREPQQASIETRFSCTLMTRKQKLCLRL